MTNDGKRRDTYKFKQNRLRLRAKGLPCAYCGKDINYDAPAGHPDSFEADHILAYAQGGDDSLDNLAASCRDCNRRKGDRLLDDLMMPNEYMSQPDSGCLPGLCQRCNGTHNPQPGVDFETARSW